MAQEPNAQSAWIAAWREAAPDATLTTQPDGTVEIDFELDLEAPKQSTTHHEPTADTTMRIRLPKRGQPNPARIPRTRALYLAVQLLPAAERNDWLEEQRAYLGDLPRRRARWAWVVRQIVAMPRYAYTVHTGREKETA